MPNFISNIKLIRFKKFSHDIALSILEIRNQDHIRKNMINDQIIKFYTNSAIDIISKNKTLTRVRFFNLAFP